MDFGFALPQTGIHASPDTILHAAQTAERLGYRTVWVLERLLRPTQPRGRAMPDAYAVAYDPIETLTYIAARTERIRLGTSVMIAPFHVPILLAKRFATLDQFSGGRAVAGLGQGWAEEEFLTANVPQGRRGARFGEFVAAMRAAWEPDPVSFSGRFYQIPPSQINPKPVRPEGVPILIAAREPPAVARAARIADGWNPIAVAWDTFEAAVRTFRDAARAAGRDSASLEIVVRTNTAVDARPAPEPRAPLVGSADQIADV